MKNHAIHTRQNFKTYQSTLNNQILKQIQQAIQKYKQMTKQKSTQTSDQHKIKCPQTQSLPKNT